MVIKANKNQIELNMDLSDNDCIALAMLLNRLHFKHIRECAGNDNKLANRMLHAVFELQKAMSSQGYKPR